MDLLQQDLGSAHPLLNIQILGVNRDGLELSNEAISDGRDLPWLQDVDEDNNGLSDVWRDSWDVSYRDVVVLDGSNARFGSFNLTSNDLADNENYEELRELLIDAAMDTQKPWTNASNPLDVNNDGFVHPLDVLLVVNKINSEGNVQLAAPTGSELPTILYDCSGDNLISPLDVVQIVNFLNAESDAGAGGEASTADGQFSQTAEANAMREPSTTAQVDAVPAPKTYGTAIDSSRWGYEVDNAYFGTADKLNRKDVAEQDDDHWWQALLS